MSVDLMQFYHFRRRQRRRSYCCPDSIKSLRPYLRKAAAHCAFLSGYIERVSAYADDWCQR